MNKILILVPHPDDEIVGTAIFIKKKILDGCEVYLFFLTNGILQKDKMWFWDRRNYIYFLKKRLDELNKSVDFLKINKFYIQSIPTRTLINNVSITYKKIQKIITEHNIDSIFTPAYEGGHQDHDVSNFIASKFNFFKNIKVYEFAEYNNYKNKIVSNEFIKLYGNEEIIKLSEDEISFKQKALDLYSSENKNLNYINTKQESYRPINQYDYSKPPHLGTLFYRRFRFFSWHPRVDSTKPEIICSKLTLLNKKIDGKK